MWKLGKKEQDLQPSVIDELVEYAEHCSTDVDDLAARVQEYFIEGQPTMDDVIATADALEIISSERTELKGALGTLATTLTIVRNVLNSSNDTNDSSLSSQSKRTGSKGSI